MSIRVVCPGCKTEYLLHDTTIGNQVRCPGNGCGNVFSVHDREQSAKASSRKRKRRKPLPPGQSLSKVGEAVPLVPAEKAGRRRRGSKSGQPVIPVQDAVPFLEAGEPPDPGCEQEPLPEP